MGNVEETNFDHYQDTEASLKAFREACLLEGEYYCNFYKRCPYYVDSNDSRACYHKWLKAPYKEDKKVICTEEE